MKALKVLTATAALGALLATPAMADVSTSIYYNDELLNTTQPVVNVDGRVLLAFRDLFENLDGQVSWDENFRMASVTYGKNTINLFPDTGAVQVNGVPQSLGCRAADHQRPCLSAAALCGSVAGRHSGLQQRAR